MSVVDISSYDNDPTLYLFTSLTAGSSHIVTATSRIETILKANKIPFVGTDTATDDKARALFQRRARGKKLPLLVRQGFVLADLAEVEEWSEFDEIEDNLAPLPGAKGVGPAAVPNPIKKVTEPVPGGPPVSIPTNPKQYTESVSSKSAAGTSTQTQNATAALAMRDLGVEAAAKAKQNKESAATAALKSPLGEKSTKTSETKPADTKAKDAPAALKDTSSATPASPGIKSPASVPLPMSPAQTETKNAPAALKAPAAGSPLSPGIKSPSSIPLPMSPAQPSSPGAGGVGLSIAEQAGQPQITHHRGSSVSSASKEEIRELEKANAIPEEVEESSEEEESDDEDEDSGPDVPPNTAVEPPTKEPVFPKQAPLATTPGKPQSKKEAEGKGEEESGEEDEDNEDEEDEDEDSSEEDESSNEASVSSKAKTTTTTTTATAIASKPNTATTPASGKAEEAPKTQAQDPKAADKASASVGD